jgi:hypothetical protein
VRDRDFCASRGSKHVYSVYVRGQMQKPGRRVWISARRSRLAKSDLQHADAAAAHLAQASSNRQILRISPEIAGRARRPIYSMSRFARSIHLASALAARATVPELKNPVAR